MASVPENFGPFEPVRRLGAGGMAETFVAVRKGPGGFEQRVCVKRILPAFEGDADFVESFLQEARTSAALRHANIVQVHDFGIANGSHYLALELVDGLDLRALVRSDMAGAGRLDGELVTLIAADLCSALEHAHEAGREHPAVVHRDVSPSNVLISRAGEVKLTDFGIARAMEGKHRTATGIIKGKVPYMPPEYIEHGRFDQRGDLFALGVLLFELLAGERPFDGESDLDTIRRIVAGQRKDLRSLTTDASPQLIACIESLLQVSPEDRCPSARDAIDMLPTIPVHGARRRLAESVRQALGEPPAPARQSSSPPSSPPPSAQAGPGHASHLRPLSDLPRPSSTQTRTARRDDSARRRPSPRALASLVVALALASSALVWALWKTQPPLTSERPQGAPPALPRSTPSASLAPAPSVAAAPPGPNAPGAEPEVSEEDGREALLDGPSPETAQAIAPDAGDPGELPAKSARSAKLEVFVVPYGNVWIDGKDYGQSPVVARLPPGVYEVGVGDVRPRQVRSVRLIPGGRERLELRRSSDTPR